MVLIINIICNINSWSRENTGNQQFQKLGLGLGYWALQSTEQQWMAESKRRPATGLLFVLCKLVEFCKVCKQKVTFAHIY